MDDMAAYEPIERRPVEASFRGYDVLTNPPPVLGRDPDRLLAGSARAPGRPQRRRAARRRDRGGQRPANRRLPCGPPRRGLRGAVSRHRPRRGGRADPRRRLGRRPWRRRAVPRTGSARPPTSRCSTPRATAHRSPARTGRARGCVVPGTGVHVNNMLGEEDLNPQGFHRIPPGRRVSSMMSPTLALRDGEVMLGLGSAGSNRIRSAILQVAVKVLEDGMDADEAVAGGAPPFRGRDGPGRAGRR